MLFFPNITYKPEWNGPVLKSCLVFVTRAIFSAFIFNFFYLFFGQQDTAAFQTELHTTWHHSAVYLGQLAFLMCSISFPLLTVSSLNYYYSLSNLCISKPGSTQDPKSIINVCNIVPPQKPILMLFNFLNFMPFPSPASLNFSFKILFHNAAGKHTHTKQNCLKQNKWSFS